MLDGLKSAGKPRVNNWHALLLFLMCEHALQIYIYKKIICGWHYLWNWNVHANLKGRRSKSFKLDLRRNITFYIFSNFTWKGSNAPPDLRIRTVYWAYYRYDPRLRAEISPNMISSYAKCLVFIYVMFVISGSTIALLCFVSLWCKRIKNTK